MEYSTLINIQSLGRVCMELLLCLYVYSSPHVFFFFSLNQNNDVLSFCEDDKDLDLRYIQYSLRLALFAGKEI